MKYTLQNYSGPADLRAMQALAQAHAADHLHVIDLPWRLTSWALDDPQNCALWFTPSRKLAGWALVNGPFWMIDSTCDPSLEGELFPQIIAWATQRAQNAVDDTFGRHPFWVTPVFSNQAGRIAALEAAGFADQADVGEDSWSQVLLERSADSPLKSYRPPKGVTIRPLNGEAEAQAYVDLHREVFESRSMTLEWRLRSLRHPDHVPDLDLVAVDEDGRLVAFCVCWMNALGGAVEPLGCRPEYRKYALGRTLLCEGLRRLHDLGARKIHVHTDVWRNTAYDLYENVGFKLIQNVRIYRKDFA